MATVDIRRNDVVQVIAGKNKGAKPSRVLGVMPDKGRVLVEHVGVVKKTVRPNPQKQIKGGIAEQERAIAISNVMIVCTSCNKPTRIGHAISAETKVKSRICKRCGAVLESK